MVGAAAGAPPAWITGVAELSPGEIARCESSIEAGALALVAAAGDAGLPVPAPIDAVLVYDSITSPHLMAATKIAEYLGLRPAHASTVGAGGATPLFAVVLACGMISLGTASRVAVVHADLRAGSGRRDAVIAQMASLVGHPQFEDPFGPTVVTLYALLADWLLDAGGTTGEELARLAVDARAWARLNPIARRRDPVTVADVLRAPRIAGALGRLDCCLITDIAAAVVVSAQPDGRAVPVVGIGGGVGHEEISQLDFSDPLASARAAATAAYVSAGLEPADIDAAFLYDSFTVTVALQLIAYDLRRARAGTGPGTAGLPVNTHGGLLSCVTGGLSHVIEATRQLRGEAGERQLPGPRHTLVTNVGGVFSHHTAAILGAPA